MRTRLTVLVRYRCQLCTDMVRELSRLQDELDFEYRLRDVDDDAALAARHGRHVPVLLAGGEELCRYFLDAERLREYCRRP